MIVLEPSIRRTDSRSLAYNKHSDFTRRIPSLSPKAQQRVEKVVMQLVHAHDVEGNCEKVKDIFFRKARLLPNPNYWEILRTVWVVAGKTDNVHEFLPFFKSSRPCKSWFMTVEDAKTLDEMEFPIMVYRAYDREPDNGISWTTDKEWCEEYAKRVGRKVKSRSVERKDIFAYISRRGENEIIIIDNKNERL
ncbi:MAG: hypothetical protein IKP36_05060 [Bacteroidaceae bacterium]|nr:hypothetical protein [Bacteroidaceae bacterium]